MDKCGLKWRLKTIWMKDFGLRPRYGIPRGQDETKNNCDFKITFYLINNQAFTQLILGNQLRRSFNKG
jgi:hypothetical protein